MGTILFFITVCLSPRAQPHNTQIHNQTLKLCVWFNYHTLTVVPTETVLVLIDFISILPSTTGPTSSKLYKHSLFSLISNKLYKQSLFSLISNKFYKHSLFSLISNKLYKQSLFSLISNK